MKAHKCDICKRPLRSKIKSHGFTLCPKHYNQLRKYGKFLDNNPRTLYDPNEIRVKGNVAYMDLYDKHSNVIATTIFDKEDIPKVKYTKWRLSASGYAYYSPKYKGQCKMFHRVILDTNQLVDHINHNKLDNRKCNLRIADKSKNQMNSNYKGIYPKNNGKWYAQIKLNGKSCRLGTYFYKEEALFARWYAEVLLFKEFRFPKEKPIITELRENDIKMYVKNKLMKTYGSKKV